MRKEIVAYLKSNPYDSTGFPLLEHLADNEFASWNDYINHMARDGSYRDQLTLYAAANLHNIDIQIVSSQVSNMYLVRQLVIQQLLCTLDILRKIRENIT